MNNEFRLLSIETKLNNVSNPRDLVTYTKWQYLHLIYHVSYFDLDSFFSVSIQEPSPGYLGAYDKFDKMLDDMNLHISTHRRWLLESLGV